jgi:hypothetical protein
MSPTQFLKSFGIHLNDFAEAFPADPAVELADRRERIRRALRHRYAKMIRCRRRIEQMREAGEANERLLLKQESYRRLFAEVARLHLRLSSSYLLTHSPTRS